MPVDDAGHGHARLEFVALRVHGEDADLAFREIVADDGRQVLKRTLGDVFEDEGMVLGADGFEFAGDGGGDFEAGLVGDDGNALGGLNAQADLDGVARARGELRVEGDMKAGGMTV